jgi:hypothetical protein
MDRMNRMTMMTNAAAALLSQAAEKKEGTAARDATTGRAGGRAKELGAIIP